MLRQLTSTPALSDAVAVLVTSREVWPVNISKVSETSFLEVVRSLGIEALVFLTIVFSGLEAIFVRLTHSFFAVVENVMVVPEIVSPGIVPIWVTPPASISKSKRTIYAIGIRTDDHDSTPSLRLRFACGDKRDTKQHERGESETANLSQIFSFHFSTFLVLSALSQRECG